MTETGREAELAQRPRRLADWEEEQGRVVVIRPRPTTTGLQGLRDRYRYWMAPTRIRLDEVGSLIWRGMDGSTSIADLAAMVPAGTDASAQPDGPVGAGGPDDGSDTSAELAAKRVGMFLRVLLDHGLASIEEGSGPELSQR